MVPFYVRETCGYDPLIDLGDFDGDSHYLGDGHWRLSLFNVGEPGNWLVDSLSDSAGWRGLSQAQLIDLMNKYPNEHVWTGLTVSRQTSAVGSRSRPPTRTIPATAPGVPEPSTTRRRPAVPGTWCRCSSAPSTERSALRHIPTNRARPSRRASSRHRPHAAIFSSNASMRAKPAFAPSSTPYCIVVSRSSVVSKRIVWVSFVCSPRSSNSSVCR